MSLSGGVFVRGVSLSWGAFIRGGGVSVQWGLCPGESSVQGDICLGGVCPGRYDGVFDGYDDKKHYVQYYFKVRKIATDEEDSLYLSTGEEKT